MNLKKKPWLLIVTLWGKIRRRPRRKFALRFPTLRSARAPTSSPQQNYAQTLRQGQKSRLVLWEPFLTRRGITIRRSTTLKRTVKNYRILNCSIRPFTLARTMAVS
uniref:Uncharacterized protein n=1 Tax=Cacopsylla melanoneura TaxID=428564 RepID=A0A8D9F9X2_9HEMI